MVISVDARPQIIECAPRQALYRDEDAVRFVFRIRRRRVTKCHVEVDVTRRGDTAPLVGPWHYTLTHDLQEQSFSTEGWGTGEYWIRIRSLVDGQPVGPYCVRKFWKQVCPAPAPAAVLELAGYPEVLVDDYCFEAVNDIQFVPDALDKHPDRPLVSPTQEHEEEMLSIDSLTWDDGADRYEATYGNSGGRIERQETHGEREHLKMLLISEDASSGTSPPSALWTMTARRTTTSCGMTGTAPRQRSGRKHTTSSTPNSAFTTRSGTVRSTSTTCLSPPAAALPLPL